MRIGEFLTQSQIIPTLSATDKDGVLTELADHLCRNAHRTLSPAPEILRALIQREQLGSTGVGEGVAIPHAKIPGLTELVACFGRAPHGVPFDAIDGQPVKLLFVLLVPENSAGAHLKALARISRLLKNADFRSHLLSLTDQQSMFDAFLTEDQRH